MNAERNELILDIATEGFWDWNLKTDRAYLSPRYCELVGYSPDDTVFDSAFFSSIIHPDDRDQVFQVMGEHLQGKRGSSVVEYRMVSRDGMLRWIQGRGKIVEYDENGAPSRMVGTILDVSERKGAEEAVGRNQSLLDNLSLQVPGILFQTVLSPDGTLRTTYASEKSHDIYELSPAQIMADISLVFQRFHPEDRDAVVASVYESGRTLTLWECEYRVLLPRQGLKWLYGTAQTQAREDGSIVWSGIVMDISQNKRAEESLRLSEKKFATVFQTSPNAVILTRLADGKYLELNDAFAELTGFPLEEAIGHCSLELDIWMDPADRDRFTAELREQGTVKAMEAAFRRKDGSVLIGEMSACAIEIDGEPCILSVARDVTEHREAVRALQESEQNLRTIMDAIPVGMAICEGIAIVYMNDSFVKHFGYSREEIPTILDWFPLAYPDPAYRESLVSTWTFAVETARANNTLVPTFDAIVTCKDGMVKHTLANTRLIQQRTLVTFTDVTEHDVLQRELLKIQKLESLGVLAGGIAHDFNNILTGIMGNISFAKMLHDPSEDAYQPLDRAEKASMRAADLARQLLVFAKGGQPVKRVIGLAKVVEEAAGLVLSGTKVRGVLDMPGTLDRVEADEGQINQSFHNIIINAVQAMPGGGVLTVRGENVRLDERSGIGLPAGDYVRITFADEGCGISQADQKKIFDPYFTTKSGGNGLGLASTFAIISKHGGHVGVQSAIDAGTTFTIHLPAASRLEAQQGSPKAVGRGGVAGGLILVMDDEEIVRELTSLALGHAGYRVETCAGGEQAVAMYRSAKESGVPFLATIMDLTIPGGMGGVEAASRIRAFDPHAVLIVSSGYSADPVMANFGQFGFIGAIEKPYKAEDLLELIGSVTEGGTPGDTGRS